MLCCFFCPLEGLRPFTFLPVDGEQLHHRLTIASLGSNKRSVYRSIDPRIPIVITVSQCSAEPIFLTEAQHSIHISPFCGLAVELLRLFSDIGVILTNYVTSIIRRLD